MTAKRQFLLTDDQIASSLSPFGVHLSAEQTLKIREYIRLLLHWNQHISLTSIEDPMEILARHFGESMFVCSLLPVEDCRLADLGAGAGFPGLALKIASPGLRLILIEANKKKCVFLSEVVRVLELKSVEVMPIRYREISAARGFFEVITARAVGGYSDILRWAKSALAPRGHAIFWLGGKDATMVSSSPGWIWQPAVKIPDSQRRYVLIGRPRPG